MLVKKLALNFICASETKFYLHLQSSKICLHMRNGHTPLTMPFWRVEAKPCWKGWCGCNADIFRRGEGGKAYGQETHGLPYFLFLLPLLEVLTICMASPPAQGGQGETEWSEKCRIIPASSRGMADCYWNMKSHLVLSKDGNVWKITSYSKPLYSCSS